jgi:dephospho-CoA kinase
VTVLGLTGNIGCGKSTVLRMFAEAGCRAFSTDEIAHMLLDSDKEAMAKVARKLGNDILDAPLDVVRKKIADVIFKDEKKRKLLESILHPRIEEELEKELDELKAGDVAVIEVPLLFEAGWDKKVDLAVLVTCPRRIRRQRAMRTGMSGADFDARERAQICEDEKAKKADYIIDNTGSRMAARKQVREILGCVHN